MVTDRTGLRRRAAELLKDGVTPETVRSILRNMSGRHDVARIVADTMHKLRIEEPELSQYQPPHVDTTGLVELSSGHFADPRSAEIILAAMRRK